MKKILLFAAVALTALTANAQNIQIHYDFGKHLFPDREHNRQDVTITYEGFKADGTGSWYYFIDADFDKNGMTAAYTELSREFTIAKLGESSTLAAHGEIDAGVNNSVWVGSYQPAFLVGAAWNWHNADFSKTFSLQVMYKQFTGMNFNLAGDSRNADGYAAQQLDQNWNKTPYSSLQVTGVWGMNFCKNKLTFAGFIDFWRGLDYDTGHGNLVILTEPQLWYNISSHCSVGTEWELSNNFINSSVDASNNHFFFNPTLAFKYNF